MSSTMNSEGTRETGINEKATTSTVNITGLKRVILIPTICRISSRLATELE